MRKINYAIYRIGSNAANQSMVQKAAIDIVGAPNRRAAVKAAEGRARDGEYTIWANQHLTAEPLSRLSESARTALQEEIFARAEYHNSFPGEEFGQF